MDLQSRLGPLLLSRRAWALSRCANLHPASQNASQKSSGENVQKTEIQQKCSYFQVCFQVLLSGIASTWRTKARLEARLYVIGSLGLAHQGNILTRLDCHVRQSQWEDFPCSAHAAMLQDHFDIRRAWQLGRLLSTVVGNTSMLQRQGRDCDIRGKKVTRRGRRVKRKCERKYVW